MHFFLFLPSQNKHNLLNLINMKKQISLIFTILLMAIIILPSCKSTVTETATEEEKCKAISADSLAALWNDAWNTKNIESLKGMIADSALVIDHEWYFQGKDSIFTKWISPSLPVISNIKTMPLKTTSCCCCISLTGLYTLDYESTDGIKSSKGNFTFIWVKQEDKTYKLDLMHMTEFHEKEKK
jgi:hypothetical protein